MRHYRKILVLMDLSESSLQVARAGGEMSDDPETEIIALHVVEFIPVEPLGESLMPSVELQADLARRAHERLGDLVRRSGIERARRRVEIGNTKAQILRVAEEESVDLIVMGSRERHGIAILVNFTEDTVLHGAHCDVLAIRLK